MGHRDNKRLLDKLVETLELPDSAYEKAVSRYRDLGEWLERPESTCNENNPHIFPQGSFRLGIAIRPLSGNEEYDLDLACNLREGVTSTTHTQKELKEKLGEELEKYRVARNINSPLEPKHRCWRLDYADTLKFHMDIVPCIPESESKQQRLVAAMESYGMDSGLANNVSTQAVAITDDRLPDYDKKPTDWMISNPLGYAVWFESRMQPIEQGRAGFSIEAKVDKIPTYKRKTPLQRAIQILKRHRDQMFAKQSDSKPISVIITTLAARSYSGSSSLESTLAEALNTLNTFSKSGSDVVENPVNPEENFADRWSMPKYSHLKLKENFQLWVDRVTRDIELILQSQDLDMLTESINGNLSISMESKVLEEVLGIENKPSPIPPASTAISTPVSKPWFDEK